MCWGLQMKLLMENWRKLIEGEVIDIDNSVHWDMAQRKVMCCLTISITVFIMVVFVYSLSNS